MKIVLVEDEEILSRVLKEKLTDAGGKVTLVSDGAKAVAAIKKTMPGIVLLDLMLPNKNGFDILKEAKADPEISNIPVIVLSNLGQDDEIKRALSLGAEDYLVKAQHPIDEVVEKVKARLGKG